MVKKKKTRAQRVGVGGTTTTTTTRSLGANPAKSQPQSQSQQQLPKTQPTPTTVSPTSTKDAAAEAARRAEEFMKQKVMAEAKRNQTVPTVPTVPTYERGRTDSQASYDADDIKQTESFDSILVQAQRAAEEAKQLEAQQKANAAAGTGFGFLFKGFSSTTTSSATTIATNTINPTNNSVASSVGGGSNRSLTGSITAAAGAMGRRPSPPTVMPSTTMTHNRIEQHGDPDDSEDTVTIPRYQPDRDETTPSLSSTTTDKLPTTSNNKPTTTASAASVSWAQPMASTLGLSQPQLGPRKRKTPTERLEEIQAVFAQSVQRAMEQVQAVRAQRNGLQEERFVSLAKQSLATQQIQQTESQLQIAVAEEDYELADQLGQVVEAHKREQSEVANVLQSITRAIAELDSQQALVVQGVANCFSNLAIQLQELQKAEMAKQEHEGDDHNEQGTLKKFASISKQLSIEQERLAQDLKHLERDEQLVAQEREELEAAISEEAGIYESQRDSVKTKLETVEEEIEELRKQLAAKQAIAAGLRTEMHGFEDSISRVRVKFARQLTRVQKKELALAENRYDWQAEHAAHQRQKEAHELSVKIHSEALLEQDQLIHNIQSELELAAKFTKMISNQLMESTSSTKDNPGQTKEDDDGVESAKDKKKKEEDEAQVGTLAQLQADVVKCEAAVSEAKLLLTAATAAVQNLEAEQERLTNRIPELEAIKKASAAQRDFKAASKASKEIKDASTRLQQVEEELKGEAAEKKAQAEVELKRLDQQLVETRQKAQEEEKLSGLAQMKTLAQKIQQLVETKLEFCGGPDYDSNNNTVKGVGALVLDVQIKALKQEGQGLGMKYGGWDDLMKEIHQDAALGGGGEGSSDEDNDDINNNNNAEHKIAREGEETDTTSNVEETVSNETETGKAVKDVDNDETKTCTESEAGNASGLSSAERISKVRLLIQRISEAEQELEAAASQEDFDKAAELQEIFSGLQTELENFDLTDAEMELALSTEDQKPDPNAATATPSAEHVDYQKAEQADDDVVEDDTRKIQDEESEPNGQHAEDLKPVTAATAVDDDQDDDEKKETHEPEQHDIGHNKSRMNGLHEEENDTIETELTEAPSSWKDVHVWK